MGTTPKVDKPKYNKDNKFAWVDSQLEKFMTEQKELKSKIEELELQLEQKEQDYYFTLRNKDLEIHSLNSQITELNNKIRGRQ